MFQGGKKAKLNSAWGKKTIILPNREIKMQLSLHPNSFIDAKEASVLSREHIPLDVMFMEMSCFVVKRNGFVLG